MSAGHFYTVTTNPSVNIKETQIGNETQERLDFPFYTYVDMEDEDAITYQYSGTFAGQSTGKTKAKPQSTLIKFGYTFNQYLGVELRYAGIGGSPDERTLKTNLMAPAMLTVLPQNGPSSGNEEVFDNDTTNTTVHEKIELDSFYGIFLRAGFHTWKLYPYAVLGYTQAEISSRITSVTFNREARIGPDTITIPLTVDIQNAKASGFSYGGGIDYYLEENFAVNLEYMSYLRDSALEIDGLNLNLTYTFR